MNKRGISPIIILLVIGLATTVTFGTATLVRHYSNPFAKANLQLNLKNSPDVIDASKLAGAVLQSPVVGITQLESGKYTAFQIQDADIQNIDNTPTLSLSARLLSLSNDPISLSGPNKIDYIELKNHKTSNAKVVIPGIVQVKTKSGDIINVLLSQAKIRNGQIIDAFYGQVVDSAHLIAGVGEISGNLTYPAVEIGGQPANSGISSLVRQAMRVVPSLSLDSRPISISQTQGTVVLGATTDMLQSLNLDFSAPYDAVFDEKSGTWTLPGQSGVSISTIATDRQVAKAIEDKISSGDLVLPTATNGITEIKSANDKLTVTTNESLVTLRLSLVNSIDSDSIIDGSITNSDIYSGANIGDSKLDQIKSANKVAGSAIQLSTTGGLENNSGLSLLTSCSINQVLKWDGSDWICATQSGGGGSSIDIQENDSTITSAAAFLDFLGSDFTVTNSPSGEANVAIDYTNSAITRSNQNETISGTWTFSSTPTITNLPNSALANSGITVTAGTGLSGGGAVSLGGSVTLSSTLGTAIDSSEITNDTIVNADINSAAAIDFTKLASLTAGYILLGNSSNVVTATALSGDITIDSSGVTTIGADKVALGTDTTGNYVAGATTNGGLALTGTEAGTLGLITSCSDNQVLKYTAAGGWACANDTTGGGSGNSFETISTASGTSPVADSSTDTLSLTAGSGITIVGDASNDSIAIAATLGNTIDSSEITNDTIVNADINSAAAIDFSKLGALTAGNILLGNSSNVATSTAMSGDITIDSSGVTTIGADKVALATDTTGNYVATVTGNSQISVSGSGSENAGVSLSIAADSIGDSQLAFNTGQNLTTSSTPTFSALTLNGNLTLANAETLSNGTDGQITFGRNDAGTVTLTAADNDSTAALTILPGGAAGLTLGGSSTTAITITTDGTGDSEVVLPANSVGNSELVNSSITINSAGILSGGASVSLGGNITLTATEADTLNTVAGRGASTATALTLSSTSNAITAGTLTINGDTFTDLTGTGLTISGGALQTTLGTAIDSSEITDDTITASDLAATLTFADGDLLDLSNINNSSTSEGLKLPQATACTSATANGQICWDNDTFVLYVGNGTTASSISNPFGVSIDSSEITNDSIVNADINSSAAIDFSKLATLTAGNVLLGNSSNVATSTALSGDVTVDSSGVTTIGADKVALATDTTGNYVATVTGNSQISVSGSGSENAGVSLSIAADSIGDSQLAFNTGQNLTTASSPSFASQTLSNTTNQLVLGTTNTTTISSTAPSTSRTYTIPDFGSNDSFVGLAATQTLTNKTISGSSNTLSNIGNSSLTNSSITINTSGILTGGASVSLGGNITLTATEADTLATVTGRGASTSTTLSLAAFTASDTFTQTYTPAGTVASPRGVILTPTFGIDATDQTLAALYINPNTNSNSDSGDSLNGINIAAITASSANETAILIGSAGGGSTGWNNILAVNSSVIINGSGVLQSAALSGTYSNALTLSSTSNAITAGTVTVNSDAITDFTGTGLQMNSGSLETTLGTDITNSEINASAAIDFSKLATLTAGNVLLGNASNIATSTTLSGDITVDNSGVTTIGADKVALGTDTTGNYVSSATTNKGLTLSGTEGGSLGLQNCADNEILKYSTGTSTWSCASDATGGTINSFETITTTSGTSPVADSSTDTLTLTAGTGITVTGDSSTDTITLAATLGTAIDSSEITNDTIVNADINSAAAIDFSKLAALTAGNILLGNGSNVATSTTLSGDITIDSSGVTTIGANTVALATDTTGNYVATITGNSQISVSGSGSENAGVSLSIAADSIGDSQLAFDTGQNLTSTSTPTFGALTLNGSLTLANSETIANSTNSQFTFGRNDAGTVTLTAADNDATAALSILPGGAAALTLGGSSTTAVTLTTDNTGDAEVVLPANSIGNSELVNSSITINSAGILTGGASVSLGGNITLTATEADTLDAVAGRGASTSTALTLSSTSNAITAGTLTISGDAFTDLTGTGLTISGGALQTTLGTAIDSSEITDNTITASDLNATLTFADSDLLDLSSINNSSASEGLLLPQATACTSATANGQICWDNDTFVLYVGNGTTATSISNPFGASIDSSEITNDTIVNADINSAAAIDFSKLATLTAGNVLLGNASNIATSTTLSGDVTVDSSGVTTIGADKVALTTDTTGNYVASVTNGNGITGGNGGSEGAALTLAVDQTYAFTWTGLQTHTNTITDDGSQSIFNLTLGNDANTDTVSAIKVAATSAATGDADTIYGLDIANLASANATVAEQAIHIGSGWDNIFDINGTLISATEIGLLDGLSGTILTSGNYSSTLDSVYVNVGESPAAGDITGSFSGGLTIGSDSVALATDTTGNYVATVTGNSQISVSGSGSENAGVSLSVAADSIGDSQLAFDTGQNLTSTSTPTFGSLTLNGSLTLANSETIANSTNSQFTFGRNDAGTVTLTAADNDATAALSILPGGAAAFTLGGASTTAITLTTDSTGDSEVVLPANSIGNSELVNSSITINSAGILTGGASVSLGGNITLTATEADTLNSVAGRGASTATALTLSSTSNAITAGTLTINSDAFTDLTGTGLTISGGALQTTLGTAIDSSEITDDTITASDLNATLTFADGDLIDLSSINNSSTTEGLKLPQATACTSATANGQICWDNDTFVLYVGNGTTATSISNPFGASIDSSEITNDTIVNADINSAAAIDFSKLAALSSGNILVGSVGNVATSVAMSGDVTIDNAGATTIGADKVALTTDTTGNYVASVTNGTGITGGNGGSEGAALTLAVDQSTAFTWTGLQTHTNTITDDGSQSTFNLTLGNDANTDTISAIKVAATSAATGDIDTVYGLDIANLASANGTVLEQAIHIGTGWDNIFDLNGTLISATELGLLDGLSGTLLTSANYTSTLDSVYVNVGESPAAGDIAGSFSGGLTVGADSVALATDTTGNYVATITGDSQVSVSGSGSENAGVSISIAANSIADAQLAFNTGQHLTTTSTPTFGSLTLNGSLTLANSETIANGTDGQILFSRNDAGTVTINAADNDANADLVIRAGGTGALTFGNASNTSITLTTDSTGDAEVVLPASSVGNSELVNSSITINSSGILTGGASVSLGGNITLTATEADTLNSVAGRGASTATALTLSSTSNAITAGTITVNADAITDFTGTGITISGGALQTTLGTAIDSSEITDNTITASDLNATLTFADSDLIDLSAINNSSTTEGLLLPQATACTSATANGQICWDNDSFTLSIGNGTTTTSIGNPFGASIDSSEITNDTIVNADINSAAAIDFSKLAALSSGNILVGSVGNVATSVTMSGDITIDNTGATTIGADKVALTTDTTGNYVTSVTNGTGITGGNGGSEGAALTLAVDQTTAFTWTGLQTHTNTITDDGSQSIFNLTLGNDANTDTISAIKVAATSATTGDADTVYGLDIANLSSADGTVAENAIHIGTGWDNVFDLNGTLISSSELTLLDGVSGTLVTTTTNPTSADISGSFSAGFTVAANAVALATDTTGNYVATVAGDSQISVSGSGSENAGVSLSIAADSIGDSQLAFNTGQNLTTTSTPTFGSLTLNGSLTLANSETIANGTDGQILFSRNDAGTVTINAADDNANADLVVRAGGTGALTLGNSSNTAITLTTDSTGDGEIVLPANSIGNSELVNSAITINSAGILSGGASVSLGGNVTLTATEADTLNTVAGRGASTATALTLSSTSNAITAGTITVNSDGITDFTGTGLQMNSGSLEATLGTSIVSGEITDDTITASDLNATLTFADSDMIDLSSINGSSTTEGLKLPQNTSCASSTANGQICWDNDGFVLYIGNGTTTTAITGGGGNSFETITTTSGSSPVADSSTDTLTLTAGTGMTVTGDSSTDTITLATTLGTAIDSSEITNDSIVNADINSAAAIDFSKLATLSSGNILVGSVGNVATSVAMSGDVTIDNTGATTIGADKVALTTDTTGNYVQSITNGTGISGGNGGGEGSALTLAVDQTTAFTWTGLQTHTNTITDDGAQSTYNLTLGNDANTDTVSGVAINVTSTATGDADTLYGLNIANITAQAVVTETAINIGTGWEQAINAGGTLISLSELQLIDGGIALSELTDSGTLTAGTVDINGGAIDGVTIGGSSAGAGTFTTLTATGDVTMNDAGADNILIGAAADTLTLTSNSLSLTDDNWSISTSGALTTSGAINANGGITTSTSNTALAFTVNGSGDFTFTADSDSQVQISLDDSSTNTGLELLRLTRTTSSTAADSIGGYISFYIENDTSTAEAARILANLRDANVATTVGTDITMYVARDGSTGELIDGMTVYVDAANKWVCGNANKLGNDGYDCFGFQIGTSNIINFSFDGSNRFNVDYSSGSTQLALYSVNSGDDLLVKTLGDQAISFDQNNDGNNMVIDTDGQVGIGTDTPANALEVLSTTTPQFRVSYDTSNYTTFAVSSTGVLTIDYTGTAGGITLADFTGGGSGCSALETNSSGVLACGTDDTGGSSTMQGVYDNDVNGSDVTIAMNTTDGSIIFTEAAGTNHQITTTAAPTLDQLALTNTGFGTTTDGVDGLSIVFEQADDADATDTNAGLNVSVSGASGDLGDILSGISINTTAQTANNREIGLTIGTGFDEDIRFASASAIIRMQDGGTLSFMDGSYGQGATKDQPNARVIEYFSTANYGVFEAGGFVNIDGSYYQDNFSIPMTAVTADVTSRTNRFGDHGNWSFDEAGTGGGSTATNSTKYGCTLSQGGSGAGAGTNTSFGRLEFSPDLGTHTHTAADSACVAHLGIGTGTNTAGVLNAAYKYVQYFKVGFSSGFTNNNSANQAFVGAHNYTEAWGQNWSSIAATHGFIGFANLISTTTATDAQGGTQWNGFARVGNAISSVACGTTGNISTASNAWALMRIEARATNDVHFFIDSDVSNGIALTECGAGVSSNISTRNLNPAMNVVHQQNLSSAGNSWTMYVDLYAHVQDDPKPENGPIAFSDTVDTNSPLDPISGADVAEYYQMPNGYDSINIGDIVSLGSEPGKAEVATKPQDRKMLGVVSEKPGLTLGQSEGQNMMPIALTGRVPVRISSKNGTIKIGDAITSSDIPGVGIKATQPGKILGTAMENFDSNDEGRIMVNINVGYYLGEESEQPLLVQKNEINITPSIESDTSMATDSAGLTAGSVGEFIINKPSVFQQLSQFMNDIIVNGKATFNNSVAFLGNTLFKGKATFEKTVEFNEDAAGYAVIKAGHRAVNITYATEYSNNPLVNTSLVVTKITPEIYTDRVSRGICNETAGMQACQDNMVNEVLGNDVKFAIVDSSTQGFMILLNKPTQVDMTFSWTATAVTKTKVSTSTTDPALESAFKNISESSSDSASLIQEINEQIATTSAILGSQISINDQLLNENSATSSASPSASTSP